MYHNFHIISRKRQLQLIERQGQVNFELNSKTAL